MIWTRERRARRTGGYEDPHDGIAGAPSAETGTSRAEPFRYSDRFRRSRSRMPQRRVRRPRARTTTAVVGAPWIYRRMRSTLLRMSANDICPKADALHDAVAIDKDLHRQSVDIILPAQRAAVDHERIGQVLLGMKLRGFAGALQNVDADYFHSARAIFARDRFERGRLGFASVAPGGEKISGRSACRATKQTKGSPHRASARTNPGRDGRVGPSGFRASVWLAPPPWPHAASVNAAAAAAARSEKLPIGRISDRCPIKLHLLDKFADVGEKPLLPNPAQVAQGQLAAVD